MKINSLWKLSGLLWIGILLPLMAFGQQQEMKVKVNYMMTERIGNCPELAFRSELFIENQYAYMAVTAKSGGHVTSNGAPGGLVTVPKKIVSAYLKKMNSENWNEFTMHHFNLDFSKSNTIETVQYTGCVVVSFSFTLQGDTKPTEPICPCCKKPKGQCGASK